MADAKEVVVETLDDGVLYGGEGAKNLVTGGRAGTLKLGPEDVPEGHRVYVQVRLLVVVRRGGGGGVCAPWLCG